MDERPTTYPGFAMSTHLAIPFLGLVLVDNTNPERLARACAEEGRYEFLFTADADPAGRLDGRARAPAGDLLAVGGRRNARSGRTGAGPAQQDDPACGRRLAVLQGQLTVDDRGGDPLRLLHEAAGAAGQIGLDRRIAGCTRCSSNTTTSAL